MALDPVIPLISSLCFAALWLHAGWRKLIDFSSFTATLRDYELAPTASIGALAFVIVCAESGLGAALLIPAARPAAFGGTAFLLIVYAAAIGVNLLRGRRHIDCGCLGPAARQPLSVWLVIRNLTLALAAAICLMTVGSRPLAWVDFITITGSVLVLALGYAAVNQLIANAPRLAALKY